MEKSYDLFLQDEHDNVTALDDLLNCPERPGDADWNFKHDLLPPDGSHLVDIVAGDSGDSISESLEDDSYLDGNCKKQENVEAKTFSTASFTFENLDNEVKANTIDEQGAPVPETNVSSSARKSAESMSYETDELSRSTADESQYEELYNGSNVFSDNCSSVRRITGDLGEKLRSFHSVYGVNYDGVKRLGCNGFALRKEVQKPPTTAGIGLEDLKAVFHLERPKAEKKLRLKRTTFSNLSRHYGISKWPFRTIRDAMNRMEANEDVLGNRSLSKSRRRKLGEQQRLLRGVIDLIYTDPRESRDSNTLAVLLNNVAKQSPPKCSEI